MESFRISKNILLSVVTYCSRCSLVIFTEARLGFPQPFPTLNAKLDFAGSFTIVSASRLRSFSHIAMGIISPTKYQVCRRKAFRADSATSSSILLYWMMFCNNVKSCLGAEVDTGQLSHQSLNTKVQNCTKRSIFLFDFWWQCQVANDLGAKQAYNSKVACSSIEPCALLQVSKICNF